MRSSNTASVAAAAVALLASCSPQSTIAFIPPTPTRTSTTTARQSSLVDQLSTLNYDTSFIGKTAAKISETAATTAVDVSGSASDAASQAVIDATASAASAFSSIGTFLESPPVAAGMELIDAAFTAVDAYEAIVDDRLSSNSIVGEAWNSVKEAFGPVFDTLIHPDLPPSVTILITSYITYSVISTILNFGQEPPPNSPYPMNKYDATSAKRYFDGKIGLVVRRAIEVAFLSGVLLTKMGPSFIKIGQSLSIRTDLLSPAYVRGLKQLQDQVPPFSTQEAREIIETELGSSIDEIFVEFPSEPIAAASLGQVYRAKMRGQNGEEDRWVAVKVQRPNIMNQIALDMHLIRDVAPFIKRTFNLNTDFVGVVDTWGVGFVDELDYIEEAINGKTFMEGIERTPLSGVVFSPTVVDELTTRKVLTTEWIVGERLDKSAKEDVSILCSIAMNTYLTMMLETGVLHCDPHPGNLLRTTDGKLCILDWGMVTRLDPDLQLTLIEHMAHLTSADYEEIPKDLLLLGFIPENKSDLIRDSGVVETLAEIYGAWTAGGGAAAINVNKVIADLQDLTAEKGNLFQIPPYFAYIAKSFSVLEGIGLSNDAKYSIINECLPYVSKRLLTDKSERTGGALSTFIFGPDKNKEDRIIDYDRVEQLVSGFGDYTTSASGELLGKNSTRAEIIEGLADQVLDLLASEEETPLQQIFIEQLAKIISSSSRTVWSQLRESSGVLSNGRTVLGTIVDPLGIFRTSPVVRANELDERTVETTRNLLQLLTTTSSGPSALDPSTLSNTEVVEISSIIVRKLWEKRSGVLATSNRLAMQLLQLTANRLERGEREILVVPTRNTVDDTAPIENDGVIHVESELKSKPKTTSERLAGARKILETIEQ
ncbi:hypothetical protein ACHAWC_007029 [Mediolabrus comicus]